MMTSNLKIPSLWLKGIGIPCLKEFEDWNSTPDQSFSDSGSDSVREREEEEENPPVEYKKF